MALRLKLAFLLVLLLVGLGRPAAADERMLEEGRTFLPSLGIRYEYDTNLYDSSTNGTGGGVGIVTPAILFSTAPERYTLLYRGAYGRYVDDSADDYNDHFLRGAAQFYFGPRGEVDLVAATRKGHWARGTRQTQGIPPSSPSFPTKPDVYERNTWGSTFRYGAEGTRGRLRFGIGGSEINNTNNRERTRYYDYDSIYGTAGLSLLFHQRTAIVLDAVFTDIQYDTTRPGEASLDSEDWRYLIGLTWEATAQTSGSIRFGIQQRRFDDSSLSNTSDPTWEVDVRWSPREYSYVDLTSSRVAEETFDQGEFIETTAYRLGWTLQWSQGWQSVISWSQRYANYVGTAEDEVLSEIALGLRYPQGRFLTWEAGYVWRSRDSDDNNLDFDDNLFSIGVSIAI